MKRTVKLTESELKRMITECVKSSIRSNKKKALKEGVHRYKGFKCVNISKDPSFPSYQVISPEGEAIGSTLFPSEMKKMVDDYLAGNNWEEKVYKKLDENVEYDDYASISESLKKILKEGRRYIPNAVYIVFDGTSNYGVFGCDVEDEIMDNDVEVVKGPFAKWDDNVDRMIEDLNDEANGTKYDRRYSLYEAKFSQGSVLKALSQCGWAYSNAYDVTNSQTGQKGVRYIIEPYAGNLDNVKPLDAEQLKQKMTELFGQDKVIFSQGQHRNAPELKNLSMIVLK